MKSLIIVLSFFAVYCTHAQWCPDTFERHGNTCYKILGLQANWIDSKKYCRLFGAELVRIDDAAEENILDGMITRIHGALSNEIYWINGADLLQENNFRWFYEDGHTANISYFNWMPGQPDNGGGREDCMELHYNGGGSHIGWNDQPCSSKRSLICESTIEGNVEIVG